MQLRDFKFYIVYPGMWGFFGGSIEDGEDPKEAAMRELFEEIGYNAAKTQPKSYFRRDNRMDRITNLYNLLYYGDGLY